MNLTHLHMNVKQRFAERKCMKVTASIQNVCKYSQSMQHLQRVVQSKAELEEDCRQRKAMEEERVLFSYTLVPLGS